jgi:hypothetical protein
MATFGNTSVGGSTTYYNNQPLGFRVTAPATGTMTSIVVYCAAFSSGYYGLVNCALFTETSYVDGSGAAGNLVAQTIAQTTSWTTPQWTTFTFSSNPSITNATKYLLCFWSGNYTYLNWDALTDGSAILGAIVDGSGNYASSFSAGWDTTICNHQYSIYANYTAGGSSIKSFDGLVYASTSKVDGLAIASVKNWNGLT